MKFASFVPLRFSIRSGFQIRRIQKSLFGKGLPITTQSHILMHYRYIAVENIVWKWEIACNKQFLFFS